MGAVELLWVILTTVFSNLVSRGTVPIMNLKKVKVAICAALQMKERKGDAQNLKKGTQNSKDLCQSATSEIYSHPLIHPLQQYPFLSFSSSSLFFNLRARTFALCGSAGLSTLRGRVQKTSSD